MAKLQEMAGDRSVSGQICDVTKEEQVQTLINTAEEKLGGVDVLIYNAGLGGSKLLVEMTDDEWNRVIDITLNHLPHDARDAQGHAAAWARRDRQ